MRELYLKILWFLVGHCEVRALSLYKGGSYSDLEVDFEGKTYSISITEKEEEEK